MKKKAVYIGLLLPALILQTTFCIGQEEQTAPKLRLLVYGLRHNTERQNAENVIAEKWGIEFYAVAGCLVSKELVDSTTMHNKQVEPLIEEKYGKDWRKRFKKEVDAEFKTEKKVSALINEVVYIKKKQKDMEMEGNGLHHIMFPVANSTKYNVFIVGWGKRKGENEWLTYYTMLVDYTTGDVQLLADQTIKE